MWSHPAPFCPRRSPLAWERSAGPARERSPSWFSKKSTQITAAAQAVTLNEQVYARVRTKVLDKLGESANDFVDGLEI